MKDEDNKNSSTAEGAQNAAAPYDYSFYSLIFRLFWILQIAVFLFIIGQYTFDSIKGKLKERPMKQVAQENNFKESSLAVSLNLSYIIRGMIWMG